MPETFYANFFASGYYIFANGILLITLAAVSHGFDREITRRFNIRWLAAGLFFTGISRVLASMAMLTSWSPVSFLETGFVILSLHFFFEYLRKEWDKRELSRTRYLHGPLFIVLACGFCCNGYEVWLRNLIMMGTGILVSITGLRAVRNLPEEIIAIARSCFVLALIGYLTNVFTLYQLQQMIAAPNPMNKPLISEWLMLLPSFVIASMTVLVMLGRHIREKRHWHSLRGDLGLTSHLLFLAVIVIFLITGSVVGNRIEKQKRFQNEVALSQAIERLAELINHRMQMASNYSAAIAASPGLVNYLENPNPQNYQMIERYLTTITPRSPDGMCFLTGSDGKIRVSSNRQDSLVGFDVSFRDYFKLAMAGQSSDLIDYGKVTGQLGFYSIHPVVRPEDKKVLGAFAVKRNLGDLEELLKLYHPAMIVDENGMVFIASDSDFEQRNYINCLSQKPHNHAPGTTDNTAPLIVHHAHAAAKLNKKGWQVIMLSAGKSDNSEVIWLMITLSLVSLTIILILNSTVISIRSREDYEVAQERFQTVFYHAPESMLIISARNLEILEANNSMKRQFGLTGEVTGASYLSLLPEKRQNISNLWHDRNEKLFKHQRTFIRSNKEEFAAEVTGAPITFNYQKAIIILLHDITAQKQIEFELRQAKNAAEEANKMKSRFFANASHEIRTPMTAIIGLTEMALTMCQSEEQTRLLKLTRSSGRSLLELVNDILDLSRIESGKFSIRPDNFDLHQLLKELEQLFEFEARNTAVKVSCRLAPELPQHIVADPVRIRQILLNLLSNALKFTESGEISLQAKTKKDRDQELLEIKVSDTGCGISREVQEHLFEPFTYSDQYTRRVAKGAGLGLAICRQITDLLEGRLFLEKTDNSGSTFTLEIPFRRIDTVAEASPGVAGPTKLTRNKHPLHFLIADDNEINLFLAGSIIEKYGGTHQYARDGREAHEMLKSSRFDMALIDIQMPELDGLSLIKMVRQSDSLANNIPIIAVSAFISDEEKQEALQAGANSYLVKPYFPQDLLRIVGQYLDTTEVHANQKPVYQTVKKPADENDKPQLKQIDMAELEIRILKKPENILKISEIFERRSKELMHELTECEQSDDSKKLREVIHSIKGLVGMLGARNTFGLARELEEQCKNGQQDKVLPQLSSLRQQITEISEDFIILRQTNKKTV
ncbi:MAG: hypothetical protein CVV42_10345 [Candidatus Riflebacteria bacterium HGW-Riflebacteria-2]|jgi:PAS domain S-box-containing protein|nr:MAG: hypothetical protein CVV42_10345 [Candidatus Riflebacteria bacterium HGW-Riflebacteria-2]